MSSNDAVAILLLFVKALRELRRFLKNGLKEVEP